MKQLQINDTIIDLLYVVYLYHSHANTSDQDGKACSKCGQPIEIIYVKKTSKISGRDFIKVDRSNRVDVNLEHRTNGRHVVSYHIDCWRQLIF